MRDANDPVLDLLGVVDIMKGAWGGESGTASIGCEVGGEVEVGKLASIGAAG